MAHIDCTLCDYYVASLAGAFCLEKERACPKNATCEKCSKFTRTDLRWRCEHFEKKTYICNLSGKPCTEFNKPEQCSAYVNGTCYGLDRVQENYMKQ